MTPTDAMSDSRGLPRRGLRHSHYANFSDWATNRASAASQGDRRECGGVARDEAESDDSLIRDPFGRVFSTQLLHHERYRMVAVNPSIVALQDPAVLCAMAATAVIGAWGAAPIPSPHVRLACSTSAQLWTCSAMLTPDEGIDIFHSRNRNLDMRRPIELLKEGEVEQVLEQAKWIVGGM